MYEHGVINSVRDFYEQLLESDEAFGSLLNPNQFIGNSKSPAHPYVANNLQFPNQFPTPKQSFEGYPRDPRAPLSASNHDLRAPQMSYQTIGPLGNHSPRDPRYTPVYPQAYQGVYAPPPVEYWGQPPYYAPPMGSLPPPPFYQPPQAPARVSRSQPPTSASHKRGRRHRRSSLSSVSSDSDIAEEISARIMASSNDPRELGSIIKSSTKSKKSLRRHHSAMSPQVQYSFPRDNSIPSVLDELSTIMQTDGSPYDSVYKSRRGRRDDSLVAAEHTVSRSRPPTKGRGRPGSKPRRDGLIQDDEIPAAVNESWFDPLIDSEEPPRLALPDRATERTRGRNDDERRRRKNRDVDHRQSKRKSSETSSRRPQKTRPQLTTTVEHSAAIVPVAEPADSRSVSRPRIAHNRTTQKDLLGEKVQTWWNPSSVATGKRQRLPVLDWRKGEKYNRAPDGTIIGKEGFENLVFDDTLKKKKTKRGYSETDGTTAASDNDGQRKANSSRRSSSRRSSPTRASKSRTSGSTSRRSSIASRRSPVGRTERTEQDTARLEIPESMMPGSTEMADRPLLNGWDYMHKNADGVYCLGRFQIISRLQDRSWSEEDSESGFIMSPSLTCEAGFVAEMILMPKMPWAPVETLESNQALFVQVLRAASNSIQVQVNGRDERLSQDDVMYIDNGSSYSITNISKEHRAVLSITFIRNAA